jgi:NAD binding domain of 6-phosphogluconate dehydrogenase
MLHVGVAGTGKMGTAIARNLLDRGYRVSVWNVDPDMMDPLVADGATPFERVESLVGAVDAMIAMTSPERSRLGGSFRPRARVSSLSNRRRSHPRCIRRWQRRRCSAVRIFWHVR